MRPSERCRPKLSVIVLRLSHSLGIPSDDAMMKPQYTATNGSVSSRLRQSMVMLFLIASVTGLMLGNGVSSSAGELTEFSPAQIDDLIEKLGSPSYATRKIARQKLRRIGLPAFDALNRALSHGDHEIEAVAELLVKNLEVSWALESDHQSVRELLAEYSSQNNQERANRIGMLAELRHQVGLNALVRICKFEPSLGLSRAAALALMGQPMSQDDDVRQRQAKLVADLAAGSSRQACQWLVVYAQDLADADYSAIKWRKLIDDQRFRIDTNSNADADITPLIELVRLCAARAAMLGRTKEAIQLSLQHMDLIVPSKRQLEDACTWAIDHQLHDLVLELKRRNERIFAGQPVLLYAAAEANVVRGNEDAADRLAALALAINPLPQPEPSGKPAAEEDGEPAADPAKARPQISPRHLEEIAHRHTAIADTLRSRGLYRWAEGEYQMVIQSLGISNLAGVSARTKYSEMLAELNRHSEAADSIEPLAERLRKDEDSLQLLGGSAGSTDAMDSFVKFQRGMDAIQQGQVEQAKTLLESAYQLSNLDNIDILITMYRLPDEGGIVSDGDQPAADAPQPGDGQDSEWRAKVLKYLQNATVEAEASVRQSRRLQRGGGMWGQMGSFTAPSLNQYAWLICNTEGDKAKALRYSLESLKLAPEQSAYMDTCARCYFATGDLSRAIQTQKQAIAIEPHSPPLKRQLAEFQAAFDAQSETPDSAQ